MVFPYSYETESPESGEEESCIYTTAITCLKHCSRIRGHRKSALNAWHIYNPGRSILKKCEQDCTKKNKRKKEPARKDDCNKGCTFHKSVQVVVNINGASVDVAKKDVQDCSVASSVTASSTDVSTDSQNETSSAEESCPQPPAQPCIPEVEREPSRVAEEDAPPCPASSRACPMNAAAIPKKKTPGRNVKGKRSDSPQCAPSNAMGDRARSYENMTENQLKEEVMKICGTEVNIPVIPRMLTENLGLEDTIRPQEEDNRTQESLWDAKHLHAKQKCPEQVMVGQCINGAKNTVGARGPQKYVMVPIHLIQEAQKRWNNVNKNKEGAGTSDFVRRDAAEDRDTLIAITKDPLEGDKCTVNREPSLGSEDLQSLCRELGISLAPEEPEVEGRSNFELKQCSVDNCAPKETDDTGSPEAATSDEIEDVSDVLPTICKMLRDRHIFESTAADCINPPIKELDFFDLEDEFSIIRPERKKTNEAEEADNSILQELEEDAEIPTVCKQLMHASLNDFNNIYDLEY